MSGLYHTDTISVTPSGVGIKASATFKVRQGIPICSQVWEPVFQSLLFKVCFLEQQQQKQQQMGNTETAESWVQPQTYIIRIWSFTGSPVIHMNIEIWETFITAHWNHLWSFKSTNTPSQKAPTPEILIYMVWGATWASGFLQSHPADSIKQQGLLITVVDNFCWSYILKMFIDSPCSISMPSSY